MWVAARLRNTLYVRHLRWFCFAHLAASKAPEMLCQIENNAPGNAASEEKYFIAWVTASPEFCIPTEYLNFLFAQFSVAPWTSSDGSRTLSTVSRQGVCTVARCDVRPKRRLSSGVKPYQYVIIDAVEFLDSAIARVTAKQTGQPFEKVLADMECDYWMNPEEAIDYGIVSRVIETHNEGMVSRSPKTGSIGRLLMLIRRPRYRL